MHGVAKPLVVRGRTGPPRWLLVVHRWLGVVIGVVMTLWCLTGFVMLYVDYPRLLPAEQLRGLSPVQMPVGGGLAEVALAPDVALASARVEMMAGRTVLRVVPEKGEGRAISQLRAAPQNYDLASGASLAPLSGKDLGKVAAAFGRNFGIDGAAAAIAPIAVDQWTVQAFRANRPLYRVAYTDSAGSTAYIAGLTGEVVQQTTRFERFWGWLGAVPHWLYPTVLRQDPAAWKQVVVWTSLAGCFLTVTGLWIGVTRVRRGEDAGLGSPYRGLWWWHHMAGLVFGLLTLTWVGSGLFSMSPWGLFDSDAGQVERQRLAGTMHWAELRDALANVTWLPPGTVRIESAPLGGKLALVATTRDGRTVRMDASGIAAPLTKAQLGFALGNRPSVASLTLLTEGDSYYYTHKVPVRLPVWRAGLADTGATRLYIDATSGTLVRAVDGTGRAERWLWNAPHSFDLPGLQQGLLRSFVLVPLLVMVTLVCGTGTWMGLNKLRRDFRRSRRRFRRRALSSALSRSLS